MMTAKIFVLVVIACSNLSEAISDNRSFPVLSRSDNVESTVIGNPANNSSTNCRLKINYQKFIAASLKDVFHHRKNGIRLNVRMESFNNKTKLSDVLPGLTWANEIGRTVISLIAEAESLRSMFFSSYTSTLNVGLETMNIVVAEMTEGCLLFSGKNVSDLVFSFLLHQLYPHDRVYDYHFDYELCVSNNETSYYNCCRLLDQAITCWDFLSNVSFNEPSSGVLVYFVATMAFLLIISPVMIGYLGSFPKERTTYKVSDSPMSISSIMHMLFIDGHGPVKSLVRKLIFSILILLTMLLTGWNSNSLLLFSMLALPVLVLDAFGFNKNFEIVSRNPRMSSLETGSSIRAIALPFNLKFWRNEAKRSPFFHRHFKLSLDCTSTDQQSTNNAQVNERTRLLSREVESQDETRIGENQVIRRTIDVFKYRLSIFILLILYLLIALPLSCFVVFGIMLLKYKLIKPIRYLSSLSPQHRPATTSSSSHGVENNGSRLINFCMFFINFFGIILIYVATLFYFINCLSLSFYLTAGLYLNAGHYSTYFIPISVVLVYSWNNWRSSVEAKYLELNTNIYKFSKENSILVSDTRPEIGLHSSDNDSSQASISSDFTRRFVINLDKNGEPLIPKPLYDIVRETLLPYDEILFPFFVKVLLVVLFAYYLFLFLSLSQSSGVTSNAKILTTMVATSIPFLIDVIWAKNSDAQKTANDLALESKLKRILKVCAVNKETEEIQVEFIGDPPTDPTGYRAS